jgi:hypothetical protein
MQIKPLQAKEVHSERSTSMNPAGAGISLGRVESTQPPVGSVAWRKRRDEIVDLGALGIGKGPLIRFRFRVPRALREAVDAFCQHYRVSKSAFMRAAVRAGARQSGLKVRAL